MDFCLPSFSPGKAREFPEDFQLDGEELQHWLSHCPVPASSPRIGDFLKSLEPQPQCGNLGCCSSGKARHAESCPRAAEIQVDASLLLLPTPRDPAGLSRARGVWSKHFPLLSNNETAKKGMKAAPKPFLNTPPTENSSRSTSRIPATTGTERIGFWAGQTLLCLCSSCSSAPPDVAIPKGWAEAEDGERWDRWRLTHLQIHLETRRPFPTLVKFSGFLPFKCLSFAETSPCPVPQSSSSAIPWAALGSARFQQPDLPMEPWTKPHLWLRFLLNSCLCTNSVNL